jgi:hypothetical protein
MQPLPLPSEDASQSLAMGAAHANRGCVDSLIVINDDLILNDANVMGKEGKTLYNVPAFQHGMYISGYGPCSGRSALYHLLK